MDPEIGSVRAQFFGGNGQVDGLQECIRVCDCDDGVQCPNERNPIFFIRPIYGCPACFAMSMCTMVEGVYHPAESA
jgi:hypothetical protein